MPACEDCNNSASEDDLEARLVIAIEAYKSRTSAGYDLWEQTLETLRGKRRARLLEIRASISRTRVLDPRTGIYSSWAPLPAAPFENVFRRIAKGLYFMEKGHRLPDDYELEVIRVDWTEVFPIPVRETKRLEIGPMTLMWDFMDDDPRAAMWRFDFYGIEKILVTCMPPSLSDGAPSENV